MLSKKAWFVEIQVQLDTFCLKYIKASNIFVCFIMNTLLSNTISLSYDFMLIFSGLTTFTVCSSVGYTVETLKPPRISKAAKWKFPFFPVKRAWLWF